MLGGHDLALAKVGRGPAQHEASAKRVAAHRSEIVRSIIVYHDVTDTDHWLHSPQRKEVLGPLGASNIRTFVDRENPQKVGVLMDIADLDSMLAAIANQSPELAAAMQHDTVRPETLTTLVESSVIQSRSRSCAGMCPLRVEALDLLPLSIAGRRR